MKIPLVSIVGRPNVGKSTLFNRLVGKRVAITADVPGTTRDRLFQKVEHPALDFFLVDTGGIVGGRTNETLDSDIQAQTRLAIDEADLILFVVDFVEGLTREDDHAIRLLRKAAGKKDIFLVANKCDNPPDAAAQAWLYRLGLGEPYPVSAMHDIGTEDLIGVIVRRFRERHFLTKDDPVYDVTAENLKSRLSLALVGKPNVGKSSIVNALLNEEKVIVSDIPGTTRDSVDSIVRFDRKSYTLIDTAGLRRSKKVEDRLEQYSVFRTLAALERAEVVVLVLDSSEKVADQDQQIANFILKTGKGAILLANKWDIKVNAKMTEEVRQATYINYLQKKFGFMPWAPVVFGSAKTRRNLNALFRIAESILEERKKRIPTAALNRCVEEAVQAHLPTGTKRFHPKIFYTTQVDADPPRFVFFVNKKSYFHFSYLRYLERKLREKFGFQGTPIFLEFKEKETRFSKK